MSETESTTGVLDPEYAWVAEPFQYFLEDFNNSKDFLYITRTSMIYVLQFAKVYPILEHIAKTSNQESMHILLRDPEKINEDKLLAEQYKNNEFAFLHSHATIHLWGSLEALVRTLLRNWLANVPAALQAEEVSRIKIGFAEYEALSPSDRYLYILRQLEDKLGSPFKQGAGRFESLLKIFGLGGEVEAEDRKLLFELSNVRNVLVHNRGVADKRFVEACSYLGLKEGEPLVITSESFEKYTQAVYNYVMLLIQRVKIRVIELRAEKAAIDVQGK